MNMLKKKFISVALLLGLIITTFVPNLVDAASEGTITVENPTEGKNYTLYRVFDLTYNEEVGAYTYTVAKKEFENVLQNSKYSALLSTKNITKAGESYKVINAEPLRDGTINPYDFSIWLQDKIANFESIGASTNTSPKPTWTGLNPLGYFMVKSDAGTVVSLTSTDYEAKVYEKNILPTFTKTVKGGSADDYKNLAYANVGEELDFKITFDVHNHANAAYTLKDVLPEGLDFVEGSLKVQMDETEFAAEKYTITKNFTEGKNLEITFPLKTIQEIAKGLRGQNNTVDGDKLADKKTITIVYKGKLNAKANMSNHNTFTEENSNKNSAELIYDTSAEAIKAAAEVRTTDFQIKKFAKKDEKEIALSGAKFKIFTQETDGEALKFTKGEGEIYILGGDVEEITTDDSGIFTIKGLKTGTYYIEETQAPDGFNQLQNRFKLVIAEDDISEPTKLEYKLTIEENQEEQLSDNVIKIENMSGNKLPETGGIGRKVIYTAGGILFFGALVLLIARKKSNSEID